VEEYWLVDLNERAVEVHKNPHGLQFASIVRLGEHDSLRPVRFPDVEIPIATILPATTR
jgi:Uma2 family endonuclease